MVTGDDSWVEMASLLLITVAEITTLFTCHSVGQITGVSPYHGLVGEKDTLLGSNELLELEVNILP